MKRNIRPSELHSWNESSRGAQKTTKFKKTTFDKSQMSLKKSKKFTGHLKTRDCHFPLY